MLKECKFYNCNELYWFGLVRTLARMNALVFESMRDKKIPSKKLKKKNISALLASY